MYKINSRKMATLFIMIVLAMTGCQKTTETEKNNVEQEISDIDDEKSNTGQILSDMLGVDEEQWIEEFEVSGESFHTVKIGATVKVPDVTGMSTLTLEEQQFNAEGKKKLLETVCTEGEIYSFDNEKMPKWFYKKRVESLTEQVENYLKSKKDGIGLIGDSWGSDDEEILEDSQRVLDSVQKAYEEAPEEGYDVGDYSANNYTGMTEKGRVIIYFNPDNKSISWNEGNLLDYSHKEGLTSDSEIGYFPEDINYGNLCKMSEEEAKNYAVAFASKLGYEEYIASDIRYLTWQNYLLGEEERELWTDGYVVTLTREVDGVLVDYTDYFSNSYSKSAGEYIQLQFNDAGLISGSIHYPRKLKTVDTQNTVLLSYRQIKEVMKSVLIEKAEDYKEDAVAGVLSFSDMELIYYAVSDAEQGTMLIPAWRLSTIEKEYNCARNPLVINAIDGSWINVWEGAESIAD